MTETTADLTENIETPAQSPIDDDGLYWAADSQVLAALQRCPREFYYSMILGYRSAKESVDLWFGRGVDEALGLWIEKRAEGFLPKDAQREAVRFALTYSYGETFDDPNKNRFTLVRAVVWYTEQFRDDPCKTLILSNGKPAIQHRFRLEITSKFVYSGKLDRVVEFAGGTYIMDWKTTRHTISPRFFDGFTPDVQMSGYAAAGQIIYKTPVSGVMIDGIQAAVGFTRIERGFAYRTKDQSQEFIASIPYWLGTYQQSVQHAGYPMNEARCFLCRFRPVCSRDPAVRQVVLDSDYIQKPWNPLEPA